MATATKLQVLHRGSMSCDLTWLLLEPGRNIRPGRTMLEGAGPRLVVNDKEKEWALGFEGAFNGAHLRSDYAGLQFETGTMIFTSDAVYMGDSYGPPATPAAIVNDLTAFYA